MSEELHQILVGCGYRYTPASTLPKSALLYSRDHRLGYYVKSYQTLSGEFQIALVMEDDPHTKLPIAYLVKIPEACRGRLIPHISQEHFLCYVAEMEADWDPNNLASIYKDVDNQIKLTLNNALASAEAGEPNDTELEGEFSTYWKPQETLYLLVSPNKKERLSTLLSESEWSNGHSRKEYITINSSKDNEISKLSQWLKQRGLDTKSIQQAPITSHFIPMRPSQLAGVPWPPASFRDVLTWLTNVDHNARDRMIDALMTAKMKRNIFLLHVERQDMLAFYVEINHSILGLHRNHKQKRRKSIRALVSQLGSKQVALDFKRLNVIKADRDTLLSRNLPRPGVGNLSDKRIALIGCGTIGGYLADLLLRSGAGCGEHFLDLYDDDDYKPHNFGRHVLTAHNFGRYKADALADSLMSSVHMAKHVRGITTQFPITPEVISNYNIVIDTTGRPPVSKRLASVVRSMQDKQRPILIHAFNDGNGRASKILVDNGSCCYGCMVTDHAEYRNGIDLRFESVDQESERNISCGSTYTPYDAAVSHITAALAQMAVLNTLEPVTPWTYNEHMLDGSRSRKPRFQKRQLDCSICANR